MNLARVIFLTQGSWLQKIGGLYDVHTRFLSASLRLEIRGRNRKPLNYGASDIAFESTQRTTERLEMTAGTGYENISDQFKNFDRTHNIRLEKANESSTDHEYFKKLTGSALSALKPDMKTTKYQAENVGNADQYPLNISNQSDDTISRITTGNELDDCLKSNLGVKPALPKKSYNLAAFVGESETLTNLVKLGVNLSKVERDVDAANCLVKLDFVRDIQPYLSFLHRNGVKDDGLGACITKGPKIFQQSLEDLEVRVDYFKSKKFSAESIGSILTKSPGFILLSTKEIDSRLGFLQRLFSLSGDEVRLVITQFPKIALWDSRSVKEMRTTFSEFLGFEKPELKQLLILCPRLYLSDKHAIKKRFNYIHNVIGYSHKDILSWPSVLRTRLSIIKPRHLFLKHLGRDQFDPKKENYVSLKALALGRDVEFCENFAKVPVQQFNDFLKTL